MGDRRCTMPTQRGTRRMSAYEQAGRDVREYMPCLRAARASMRRVRWCDGRVHYSPFAAFHLGISSFNNLSGQVPCQT